MFRTLSQEAQDKILSENCYAMSPLCSYPATVIQGALSIAAIIASVTLVSSLIRASAKEHQA